MAAQRRRNVSVDDLPPFLTVEEAAAILRLSRSAAYELANRYLTTDGREGLPAIRLGRSIRIPRAAVLALLAVGAAVA